MRIYNKWYKELWWAIIENLEAIVLVLGGIVLGTLLGCLLVWLLER